jgi:hypothetical protein
MMNGKKHGCRTADIQGGAVRQPGEYSFPWQEQTTRHQNGYSG